MQIQTLLSRKRFGFPLRTSARLSPQRSEGCPSRGYEDGGSEANPKGIEDGPRLARRVELAFNKLGPRRGPFKREVF